MDHGSVSTVWKMAIMTASVVMGTSYKVLSKEGSVNTVPKTSAF